MPRLPGAPRVPLAALALLMICTDAGCRTAGYLAEQGRGQFALLRARRRVADVLTDPSVAIETRRRLALANEARAFGVRALGLRGGDAFTRFVDTHGEPIAWSVYAAHKDRLAPYLHRFPIAGAIPYLGFFDKAAAERERTRLDGQGLDTSLVAVAGYSTLGFTLDPIYSSMLEGPPARIVEVVLHEMLHATVYRPGQSEWNESLATLVGLEGARAFFSEEINPGRTPLVPAEWPGGAADAATVLIHDARERERKAQEVSRLLAPVVRELEALYAEPVPSDEKLRRREPIFERAMEAYRARFPPPPGLAPNGKPWPPAFTKQRLNNAVLLSLMTYHRGTPALRQELLRTPGGLPEFIAHIKARWSDP